MACRIERTKSGDVNKVYAPNGQESVLYNKLREAYSTSEEALSAWATVYTTAFQDKYGRWLAGQVPVLDQNGEPLAEDVLPELLNRPKSIITTLLINGALKLNSRGIAVDVIMSGKEAQAIANQINSTTDYTVKAEKLGDTSYRVSPTDETYQETLNEPTLQITTPIIVDYIEVDPEMDSVVMSQTKTPTAEQKQTLEVFSSLRRRVGLASDEKNYILDGSEIMNRTSNVIAGLKGPAGQEGYYAFDGDPNDYEDNREWGNQLDDILEAVLRGENLYQARDRHAKGIAKRGNDSAKMARDVVDKAYNEFQDLRREFPDSILLTQQVLVNPAKRVAGTADIIVIHKDGTVDILDLKSSIWPTSEPYEKTTASGEVVTNSYSRRFPSNTNPQKASKRDRHQAQLTMYQAMLIANGIRPSGRLETVHMYLAEVDGTIVLNVEREPNQKHTANQDILNEFNTDPNYEGQSVPNIGSNPNFQKVINKIMHALEQKKQQHIRNDKPEAVNFIKSLQKTINTTQDISAIIAMVDEAWNTLEGSDKFKGYFKMMSEVISDIQNDRTEARQGLVRVNDGKDVLQLYLPVLKQIRDFLTDVYYVSEGLDIPISNDTDTTLGKIKHLTDKIEVYENLLSNTVPKLQADFLWPYLKKGATKAKIDLANLKQQIKDAKEGSRKRKNLETRYNKLSRRNMTRDKLEEMIKDGSYIDIGNLFDIYFNPAVSSSNEIVAGLALAVKDAFEDARMQSIDFQQKAGDAFNKYQKNAKGRNNVTQFNKPFYTAVNFFKRVNEDGEVETKKEMHFKSDIDYNAYEKAKADFELSIADLPDMEKVKARGEWYMKNTEHKTEYKVGDTIVRESADQIIARKKKELKPGHFEAWKTAVIKNFGGVTTYVAQELRQPKKSMYGQQLDFTSEQQEYYDFLLSSYIKSQAKLPKGMVPGLRLPSIAKNRMDRLGDEGGIKQGLKYEKDSLAFVQEEDIERFGDQEYKAIPVLFTQDMNSDDVSLDLISSIIRFDDAANLYKARSAMAPLATSLLESVERAAPVRGTSTGEGILDKVAEKVGLSGWDKYFRDNNKNNVQALLAGFIDMQIYGKYKNKEMFGKFDFGKFADSIITYGSITNIGANPILGVANWLQAGAMAQIEAHSKQFFTPKEWAKGLADYNKYSKDFISDYGKSYPESFIGQLIELYDPLQGTVKDKFGRKVSQSVGKRLFSMDTYYFTQSQGEHHIQVSTFLAMMNKHTAWDANGNEVPLLEAYENPDGKIKLKEGYTLKGRANGIVDGDIRNALHSINKSMHGVYNSFDRPIIEKHALGRLIMMFRKFLVPGFKRRYQDYSVNYESGETREGYWRTFMNHLVSDANGLLKYMHPAIKAEDVGLTTTELANIRRAGAELVITLLTMVILTMLASLRDGEEDDDTKWALSYPLYWAMRLRSELMYYMNPTDLYRSFRSPTAAYSTLERATKFLSQVMEDTITLSPELYKRDSGIAKKGDPKSWIYFLKLLGINGKNIQPEYAIKVLQLQLN
jgi:hypothetical protein